MDDTALDLGAREDRLNRVLETRQAIDTGDKDILDAPTLQIGDHTQPEVGRALECQLPHGGSVVGNALGGFGDHV